MRHREPIRQRTSGDMDAVELFSSDFHPNGRWATIKAVAYPLYRPYPKMLRGHGGLIMGLVFAPDGSWLASSSIDGELIQWPLSPEAGAHHRVLMNTQYLSELAVEPFGRFLAAAPERAAAVPALVDLKDGSSRWLEVRRDYDRPASSRAAHKVAVGPQGKRVAADFIYLPLEDGGITDDPEGTVTLNAAARRFIQVWDLETGSVQVLETGEPERVATLRFMADGRLLSSFYNGDIRSWNVDEGTRDLLLEKSAGRFDVSRDGRTLLAAYGTAAVYDLVDGSRRELPSHSQRVRSLALDPTGRIVLTGDRDGIIRVGPITGEEPHLLLGHEGAVSWIKVSPKGDWIASGGADHTVRLWPMPDLDKQPFHTLPYEEFLDRLRGLTNLRAVRDEESSTGYRIDIAPFPGFGKVPEW